MLNLFSGNTDDRLAYQDILYLKYGYVRYVLEKSLHCTALLSNGQILSNEIPLGKARGKLSNSIRSSSY